MEHTGTNGTQSTRSGAKEKRDDRKAALEMQKHEQTVQLLTNVNELLKVMAKFTELAVRQGEAEVRKAEAATKSVEHREALRQQLMQEIMSAKSDQEIALLRARMEAVILFGGMDVHSLR
jgi:hypothetical protein